MRASRRVLLSCLPMLLLAAMPTSANAGYNTGNSFMSRMSGNCVAYLSAPVTKNGFSPTLGQGGDPSHGVRRDEMQRYMDSCMHGDVDQALILELLVAR